MDDLFERPIPQPPQDIPKIPFIDASHHLQIEKDDKNCALYGISFIQGIGEMLKQPTIAGSVFELARSVKSNPSATAQLVRIFQEDLKAYLPCYYDASGSKKSQKEIEDFHLHQRWELGRRSISVLHPIKEPMIRISEKNLFLEKKTDSSPPVADEVKLNPLKKQ